MNKKRERSVTTNILVDGPLLSQLVLVARGGACSLPKGQETPLHANTGAAQEVVRVKALKKIWKERVLQEKGEAG